MDKLKILMVEDDRAIADAIAYTLEEEGYEVVIAGSNAEAMPWLGRQDISLYLLDIMLPDGTGYDICRKIKTYHNAPVIFLTACDEEANVVMGLDIGADDYIAKPFRVRELLSRIHSVLRRYRQENQKTPSVYVSGSLKVSMTDGKVFLEGKEVCLSALEYKLFLYLIRHEGLVVTREQLLSHIFDISGEYVNDNTLTVYIKRLREKLEEDAAVPRIIKTVRGLGYILGERHV